MPIQSIDIDEAALNEVIENLGAAFTAMVFRRGMDRGLAAIHERLPPYPTPRTFTQVGAGSRLKSKGSRRVAGDNSKWWASTYKRTGTLGKSITTRTEERGSDLVGRIGTNVTVKTGSSGYAQFVIGNPQAWMHAGRWWQLEVETGKHLGLVSDSINNEINKALGL